MRRLWKRLALCFLAFCASLLAAWLFRASLLRGAAHAWIVSDRLQNADAIIVLGGGLETRPFEAARLYHQGIATHILLLDVKLSETDKLGITKSGTELSREVLLKQGVPENVITVIGKSVASTRDEALAVRDWVREAHPDRIIIPTDLFHTRRVNWLFQKMLRTNGVEIVIDAIQPHEYEASNWWQHEEGLIGFQNEVIKLVWYRVKY